MLQFISSVVSLGIFSSRFLLGLSPFQLTQNPTAGNGSYGSVESMVAAAVLSSDRIMISSCLKKSANPGGRTLR
ncbi:hypothetical protein PSPO01_16073 [Paraphaeosphaeria sporulosa]